MRIGFDAKRAFLNNTGLGNYSRDTIRLLFEFYNNNKYFLYTPKESKNVRLNFLKNRRNILIQTPDSLIKKLLKSYWRSRSIVKDLLLNKIDIYHGLTHELPLGIEKTNIKTVVTIHDLIFIRYPNFFSLIDRKIYYKKIKSSCERADKIIAISKQTKKDIIKFLNIPDGKIEVVYQGCNKVFQSSISTEVKNSIILKYKLPKNYILYVGTIEKRKNLLTLLKAIKELPKQHLVVVGHGKDYKKDCEKYIQENKLHNKITLLSNISIDEIASIYQTAKLMIYPSIFEGFGIPILEALFSKVPVITSKGGCFSEAGGPETKYINCLSVNEIKEAILNIQGSSILQKRMKKKGYEYAQNFTDDKIAYNLIQLYKELKWEN